MKKFSFYHRVSGEFHPTQFGTDDPRESVIKANTPPDHIAIQGEFDASSQRMNVETGRVVDYKPPQPSPDYEWSETTRRWYLSAGAADRVAKRVAAEARIIELERSQHRALREHALGVPGGTERLKAIEAEISGLRTALAR